MALKGAEGHVNLVRECFKGSLRTGFVFQRLFVPLVWIALE